MKEQFKKGRVLLDFYADWCGPCKSLARELTQYKKEVTDVEVIKINIDTDVDLVSEYNIRSIPTLIYLIDGEITDRTAGVRSVAQLKEFTKLK